MREPRRGQGNDPAIKRPGGSELDTAVRQALALHQAGRLAQAEGIYRQVLAAKSGHAAAAHFLGLLAHQTGRSAEGLEMIERSVKLDPKNTDFLNNRGTVLRDLGQLGAAAHSFRRALALKPDNQAAADNLGSIANQMANFEEAERVFRASIARNAQNFRARIGLADTLMESGRLDEALSQFHEALADRPGDPDILHGLGVALMEKGSLDEAADTLRKAIAINPSQAKSWQMLSQVKPQKEADAELTAMRGLHDRVPAGSFDRMQLAFALGKANDDLKQYGQAFEFFREANDIRRRALPYDSDKTRQEFAAMKETFSRAFFANHRPSPITDNTPIFVVGMPRSGTTLVEQIISAHPQVFGAGELTILRTAVGDAFPLGMKGGFPAGVAAMPDKVFANAGQDYLNMLRARYPGYHRVTDKMPGNFLLIGFLHMMLPNARIVHCARDAVATCLSIYKTNFRGTGHSYSYDLGELADFHNLYVDMMKHWQEVLPGVIHEVRYENFVADQEGQSRALIEYLGLPWNDEVLAFHQADRQVRTASAAQVRQPMYRGSVDLWKRYGDSLKPLIERLK